MSDLDKRVAEAFGMNFIYTEHDNQIWLNSQDALPFTPSTNWQQAGELQVKYGLNVSVHCTENEHVTSWKCCRAWPFKESKEVCASTPQEAICLAVIALLESKDD